MKIQYQLRAEDYLMFQLYQASRSAQVKRNRMLLRTVWPVLFLALAIYLVTIPAWAGAIIVFLVAVGWYFLYPLVSKHQYIRHYKKYTQEHYKENLDKSLLIEDRENDLHMVSPQADMNLRYNAITEINDIGTHYFIHFDNGVVAVLPINREVGRNVWDDFIKQLALKSGKSVYDKKDWEWE